LVCHPQQHHYLYNVYPWSVTLNNIIIYIMYTLGLWFTFWVVGEVHNKGFTEAGAEPILLPHNLRDQDRTDVQPCLKRREMKQNSQFLYITYKDLHYFHRCLKFSWKVEKLDKTNNICLLVWFYTFFKTDKVIPRWSVSLL